MSPQAKGGRSKKPGAAPRGSEGGIPGGGEAPRWPSKQGMCPLALAPPQAAAVQIEEMDERGRRDTPVLAAGMLTESCHLPSFPVMLGPGGLQLQRHVMASECCLLGGSLREKTEASGCPFSPGNPPGARVLRPGHTHTGSPSVGEAASGGNTSGLGSHSPLGHLGSVSGCFSSSPSLLGALRMFLGPDHPPLQPDPSLWSQGGPDNSL